MKHLLFNSFLLLGIFTNTLYAQLCEIEAPAVNVCTNSETGEIVVTNDGTDISAPFIIEYIITDDAAGTQTGVPNSIISIGSAEDAQAAISAASGMGGSIVVTTIVHNTEHLDQIREDLDICTNNIFSLISGITAPLQSWEQLYDGITSANGGNNPNLTITDIEAQLTEEANGDPSPAGVVQINTLIPEMPIILCDVSEYCYKIDNDSAITIGDGEDISVCSDTSGETCEIQAPTANVCTDSATGEIVVTNNEINLSAPFIIEYIITDDDAGSQTGVPNSIIGIGSAEDAQAAISAAGAGAALYITAIVHNSEQLTQIAADINDCIPESLAPIFNIPIASWQDVYDNLILTNMGSNPNLTLEELITNLGYPENGPSQQITVDLGASAGLPPGVLICTLPEYCYNIAPSASFMTDDVCPPSGTGNEIVPTLSQWSLVILSLLILIIGIVSIRQSKRAVT